MLFLLRYLCVAPQTRTRDDELSFACHKHERTQGVLAQAGCPATKTIVSKRSRGPPSRFWSQSWDVWLAAPEQTSSSSAPGAGELLAVAGERHNGRP